jgi:hypothetical protein
MAGPTPRALRVARRLLFSATARPAWSMVPGSFITSIITESQSFSETKTNSNALHSGTADFSSANP